MQHHPEQLALFPESPFGKTYPEPCLPTTEPTLSRSSTKWLTSGRVLLSGLSWTRNISESPNDDGACSSSLSSILQPPTDVPTRYYLSAKAAEGILRRAERRGKTLPEALRQALVQVAHTVNSDTATTSKTTPPPL